MDEFIALLNDQRQLLDDLLYRLVAARGVLAAGEIRFVGRASAEIETVINEIYGAESRRSDAIAQIAVHLGIAPKQITLRSLAQAAPEPYHSVLEHLHGEFLRLADEIERAIATNRSLAAKGAAELSRMLTALGSSPSPDRPLTYGPNVRRRTVESRTGSAALNPYRGGNRS